MNVDFSPIKIDSNPSETEMKLVLKGMEEHNKKHPNGELDIPIPDISLVLRNDKGEIIGGVITSMLTGIMHLEVLWLDEKYRGCGYGRELVLEAEIIGQKKGYPAAQTWTFSFQAPMFYQSIGYKLVGMFDGYTDEITEYILLKKFDNDSKPFFKNTLLKRNGFTISEDSSESSMRIVREGLRQCVAKHVGDIRQKYPEKRINLVMKNGSNQVIGGLHAYTTLRVVHIVFLWIEERNRNKGLGTKLLKMAEGIAKENGCISVLLNVLSFQSPFFFQSHGYEVFGISDGYADSIKEYFLLKRL